MNSLCFLDVFQIIFSLTKFCILFVWLKKCSDNLCLSLDKFKLKDCILREWAVRGPPFESQCVAKCHVLVTIRDSSLYFMNIIWMFWLNIDSYFQYDMSCSGWVNKRDGWLSLVKFYFVAQIIWSNLCWVIVGAGNTIWREPYIWYIMISYIFRFVLTRYMSSNLFRYNKYF